MAGAKARRRLTSSGAVAHTVRDQLPKANLVAILAGMVAKRKKQAAQGMVTGRVEKGGVRLLQPVPWDDGQQVVIIPLPSVEARSSPPVELLDEDAVEFARRPQTLAPINRGEIE